MLLCFVLRAVSLIVTGIMKTINFYSDFAAMERWTISVGLGASGPVGFKGKVPAEGQGLEETKAFFSCTP